MMRVIHSRLLPLIVAMLLLLCGGGIHATVSAQTEPTPDTTQTPVPLYGISHDEINAIAAKMYCPECAYIPLDKCGTPVCIQWKSEIAQQLAQGRSEQAIIDDFVARFGDQVVGIPQDPTLRNISLILPLVAPGFIILIGVIAVTRWRQYRPLRETPDALPNTEELSDDYRSQLERDLEN